MSFAETVLPAFRYHPDPVRNGTIVRSTDECESCGLARGWIYRGPIDGPDDVENVCPFCIADGQANDRLDVTFGTEEGLDDVASHVRDEVSRRTPGFIGWQEERWLVHCGDAAAFIQRAGAGDLDDHPGAIDALRREAEEFGWSDSQTDEYLATLSAESMPTAYLFRCLHCGQELAYSDFT